MTAADYVSRPPLLLQWRKQDSASLVLDAVASRLLSNLLTVLTLAVAGSLVSHLLLAPLIHMLTRTRTLPIHLSLHV